MRSHVVGALLLCFLLAVGMNALAGGLTDPATASLNATPEAKLSGNGTPSVVGEKRVASPEVPSAMKKPKRVVARVVSVVGTAAFVRKASGRLLRLRKGYELVLGDVVVTYRAKVTLRTLLGTVILLGQYSVLTLDEQSVSRKTESVSLLRGRVLSSLKRKIRYRVVTPSAQAGVRGTEFLTAVVDGERTVIRVYEGEVFVQAAGIETIVRRGFKVVVPGIGKKPQKPVMMTPEEMKDKLGEKTLEEVSGEPKSKPSEEKVREGKKGRGKPVGFKAGLGVGTEKNPPGLPAGFYGRISLEPDLHFLGFKMGLSITLYTDGERILVPGSTKESVFSRALKVVKIRSLGYKGPIGIGNLDLEYGMLRGKTLDRGLLFAGYSTLDKKSLYADLSLTTLPLSSSLKVLYPWAFEGPQEAGSLLAVGADLKPIGNLSLGGLYVSDIGTPKVNISAFAGYVSLPVKLPIGCADFGAEAALEKVKGESSVAWTLNAIYGTGPLCIEGGYISLGKGFANGLFSEAYEELRRGGIEKYRVDKDVAGLYVQGILNFGFLKAGARWDNLEDKSALTGFVDLKGAFSKVRRAKVVYVQKPFVPDFSKGLMENLDNRNVFIIGELEYMAAEGMALTIRIYRYYELVGGKWEPAVKTEVGTKVAF